MPNIAEGQQSTPAVPEGLPRPYWAATTRATPPLDEVRQRIPGWGVDLDYNERTAVPMEDYDPGATGAHWDFPERQPELWPREKSPEHAFVTPVFGTVSPPKGLSGMIRKYAYTLGEGKASHWLLLMAADRVDVVESMVESTLRGKPDNPITETGVVAEFTRGGIRSRVGQNRADLKHQPLDVLIVAAPWLIAGYIGFSAVQGLTRKRRTRKSKTGRSRGGLSPSEFEEWIGN